MCMSSAHNFTMETVHSILAAVHPLDWTCSIDLKDVYLHVPIHPTSYINLWLAIMPTEVFYFWALPFCLNTAPLLSTQIVESVVEYLRLISVSLCMRIPMIGYFVMHCETLLKLTLENVAFLYSLGWEVNLKKSSRL